MSEEQAFDLASVLMESVAGALEESGAEMAAIIRESISRQCPPHSSPGEPPALETGLLLSTVDHVVTMTGPSEMVLSVGAGPAVATDGSYDFDYAGYLETSMNRPYVLVHADELADIFIAKFTND